MPDREKVISEFSECVQRGGWTHCGDCEYKNANVLLTCEPLAKEILALLKEQEAVEPKPVDLYGKEDWWGLVCVCPDCKAEWMSDNADTHFCPKCGQAVKWE